MTQRDLHKRRLEDPTCVGWIYDWLGDRRALSVYAVQMSEPFAIETGKALLRGRPGDYLMRYSTGAWDVWPQASFERSWQLRTD